MSTAPQTSLNQLLQLAEVTEKSFYSLSEISKILMVPRDTVLLMVKNGKLPGLSINRKRQLVSHDGLAAAVQGFVRLSPATVPVATAVERATNARRGKKPKTLQSRV